MITNGYISGERPPLGPTRAVLCNSRMEGFSNLNSGAKPFHDGEALDRAKVLTPCLRCVNKFPNSGCMGRTPESPAPNNAFLLLCSGRLQSDASFWQKRFVPIPGKDVQVVGQEVQDGRSKGTLTAGSTRTVAPVLT